MSYKVKELAEIRHVSIDKNFRKKGLGTLEMVSLLIQRGAEYISSWMNIF